MIQEITDLATLEALAPAWRQLLHSRADLSPFQSAAWLLAWTRAFRPSRLWSLAVWEGGALVGLAPFFVYTRPQDGRRQLTLLGNGISDRLDLLAEPGRETAVGAAVFEHLRRAEVWDACDWRDLAPGSVLLAGKLVAASDEVQDEEPCPALALPHTPEAVVQTLPRKRRENLRRRSRRLAELGRVSFETADAASRADALQALLRLHGSRWAARGERGVLAEEAVRGFHEDATRGLLAEGLLRLQVLKLDGRVIAAHYGLGWGGCAYSYIHGFDPELAALGPSALLIAEVMADAVRHGATRFDFLRGREPYKYDWGAVDAPQHRRRVER